MRFWLLPFWLVIVPMPIQAGTPLADIAIEVGVEPNGVTPPGTEGTVSLTITNYGPDVSAALIGWAVTSNGVGFSFPPLDFVGVATGPCGISPIGQPGPGDNFGFQVTPALNPGESVTCTYGFEVRETMILSQMAQWGVGPNGLAEDPNQTNNLDEVLLIFSPLADTRPVPALSWVGIFVLMLSVGLIAIRRIS